MIDGMNVSKSPMLTNEKLVRLSGTQQMQLIADGQTTVVELVLAHLERIELRNQDVLAFVFLDKELILNQATLLDSLPLESRGPLHGLLVAIKDIISTVDMPTHHNSQLFKDSFPAVDASVVSILRSSGALIFAKTTTVEFAAYRTISPTKNPHDPTKTPGGSSSGSASAVIDCQIPVALGTQTAGSIIRPAAFCGTLGFKATWGAVGMDGVKVFSPSNDALGFFTRSVDDLLLLSTIFRLSINNDFPLPDLNNRPLKIAIYKTPAWSSAFPETVAGLLLAEELLSLSGATITHIDLPPQFDTILESHRIIMASEAKSNFLAPYLLSLPVSTPSDNPPLIHPDLVAYVHNSTKISNTTLLKAYDEVAALRPQFDSIATEYDAILSPSTIGVAVDIATTGDPRFCSMWTILHSPVINIPLPRKVGELPLGITLVGRRFGDLGLLLVAKEVEAVFKK